MAAPLLQLRLELNFPDNCIEPLDLEQLGHTIVSLPSLDLTLPSFDIPLSHSALSFMSHICGSQEMIERRGSRCVIEGMDLVSWE